MYMEGQTASRNDAQAMRGTENSIATNAKKKKNKLLLVIQQQSNGSIAARMNMEDMTMDEKGKKVNSIERGYIEINYEWI